MAKVSFVNVGKQYGRQVVIDDLNLEIEDGEFVVLVGPSGCGKSTTLQMVAGLESVSYGTVLIGGRDVTELPPKSRDIAMVFQSYALFPHLNVRDNIAFGLRIRRTASDDIDAQVKRVAGRLHIEDLLDRLPKALSGGQRQRVALARALVRRPGVFLMDEPLSNLDAKLRIEARSFLTKMQHEVQTTTIYVTHDQSEAMTMGTKIVVMNEGRIQQVAAPLDAYNAPSNRFVAGFIGSPAMNFLTLRLQDGALTDPAVALALPMTDRMRSVLTHYSQEQVVLGIRPEALRPVDRGRATPPNAAVFLVEVVQHLGHETLLDATVGAQRVIARVSAADNSVGGESRAIAFDLDSAHLFDATTGVNLTAGASGS